MSNIIDRLNQEEISKLLGDNILPKMVVGDSVSVSYETQTGDQRIFRGVIISMENKKIMSSITVLKSHANAGGRLSRKFFIFSPRIQIKVDNLGKAKIRRAKLYYLTKLHGKSARLQRYNMS